MQHLVRSNDFFHITNEDILEMFQEKHSSKGVGLACVHVEIPYDI